MLRKHKKYVQWHFAAIRIVIVVLAIVVVVGAVVITVVAGAVKHLSQGHSAKYSQNSFWLMNYEWADDLYGPLCTVLCPLVARRNNICLFIYFAFHLSFFRISMHINYKAGSIVEAKKKENKRKRKSKKKEQKDQPKKLKSSASEYFRGVGEKLKNIFHHAKVAPTWRRL